MKRENYIVIQGWMICDLELTGNELVTYALIYGFCQDGVTCFTGSLNYISKSLHISVQSVISILKKLQEKGLIRKNETTNNGVKNCTYSVVFSAIHGGTQETLVPTQETLMGYSRNFSRGTQETLDNNIVDKYNDINKHSSIRVRDFKNILLDNNNRYWQETICLKHHIDINKLYLKVDEFVTSCIARGTEIHDNPQEIKRHFDSWLTIALNTERKEQASKPMNAQERRDANIEAGIKAQWEAEERLRRYEAERQARKNKQ